MTSLKLTLVHRFPLCLGLAAFGLSACDGGATGIDPQVVTERAALHAQAVMHESGLALGFTVAEDGTVTKLMGSSSTTASSVVAPALSGGMPPSSMLRALVGPELTQQMTGVQLPSMLTTEERFDDAGDQLGRLMRQRLFVASNLESKDGDTAIYLLHADPTCRPLPEDTDPPGTVPPVNQKCADDFAKVAVRVAVKTDGDGARLTVLVGPARLELAAVVVHSDELAVEVDLPKTKAASDFIQQQLGDGGPVKMYARLAGKLRASLKKVGDQKVTAAWAVLQALDIAPSSGGTVRVAASDPVFALTSDGSTKTAELQLGLGATDIGATWDPQSTGAHNDDFHVVIGGLYGRLSLQEAAQQILLTDLGIGATKVTVRGTSIMDLNLNPDAMRRFSGKLSTSAGLSRLELTPLVDLHLGFDYNAIASDFTTPPPVTIGHESYAVNLVNVGVGVGVGAATVIEEAPSTAAFAGGLRMVAGALTIAAASVPAQTVVVSAGKCLSTTDTVLPGAHPILGKLVVSDCP